MVAVVVEALDEDSIEYSFSVYATQTQTKQERKSHDGNNKNDYNNLVASTFNKHCKSNVYTANLPTNKKQAKHMRLLIATQVYSNVFD